MTNCNKTHMYTNHKLALFSLLYYKLIPFMMIQIFVMTSYVLTNQLMSFLSDFLENSKTIEILELFEIDFFLSL